MDPRIRSELRRLTDRIGTLQRDLENVARASQARNRTVEGGGFEVYDEDGNLRTIVGAQPDGTYTIRDKNGPIPPAPAAPTLSPFPGGLLVTWDGVMDAPEFSDRAAPDDFLHVEVHASTDPDFVANDDTQRATIPNRRGGTAAISLPAGAEWYVALQTVTTSHRESVKSAEVVGTPFLAGNVEFEQETGTASGPGDMQVVLQHEPIVNSEHVYWEGVYQPGSEWFRSGQTVTLLDPDGALEVGDQVLVEYAYRVGEASEPTLVDDVVGFSRGSDVIDFGIQPPAGIETNDLLLLAVAMPPNVTVSALNGYTFLGQTANVSAVAGSTSDTLTYRMGLFARTKPEGITPLPAFTNSLSYGDASWVMAAFRGPQTVAATLTEVAAMSQTAATPARAPADLRIWAAIGDTQPITPVSGIVVAEQNNSRDLNIVMTASNETGEVFASVPDSAAWMLATLTVGE